MSFNNAFSAVTGATYTAAQYNTFTRDNFTAIWAYTTAGDIVYATSATTLARLGIGTNGSYFSSNGSVPSWVKFYRIISYQLNTDIALNTGDNCVNFRWPSILTGGWTLQTIAAARASGTGVLTIQIRNITTGFDLLTTKVTVDSGETDSNTAAVAAVIDGTHNTMTAGDHLSVDVDDAGVNTLFGSIEMGYAKP